MANSFHQKESLLFCILFLFRKEKKTIKMAGFKKKIETNQDT